MSDLERLKTGICPFTGKRYDCGRCEAAEWEHIDEMAKVVLPETKVVPIFLAKSGDAAAMRAALEAVRDAFDSNDFGAMGDHPSSEVLDMADAVRRKVDAALAAPARNCDLFADYASALEYWQTHEECAEVNGCFDVWLMARAEGGKA